MPDLLFSTVARKTVLTDRYLAHAAHQSMTGYLADWEAAQARLTRQIVALRAARDARRQAAEDGTWPSRGGRSEPHPPKPATVSLSRGCVVMPDDVLDPPPDLVMCVDKDNTAHVLLPADERPVSKPTLCGSTMYDLGALHDLLDTLSAPWSLLTDRQYRAWPPWPCQSCVRLSGAIEADRSRCVGPDRSAR